MTSPPSEYPPPVDSTDEFVGPRRPTPRTSASRSASRSSAAGQAGLACAIRLLAAARGRPRADGAPRRGAGGRASRRARSPAPTSCRARVMNPLVDPGAVPGRRLAGRTYGQVEGETVYFMLDRKRAVPLRPVAAAVPQPRQLRRLGRRAQPLAGREGRGGRRVRPVRDRGAASCSSRTASCAASAPATRGATRTAARRPTSSRAPTSSPAPPCSPRAAGATSPAPRCAALRPRAQGPAGLGARRQGDLGGRAPLHKIVHTLGWPLRPQAQVQGVRRHLDLRHEPRGRDAEGLASASSSASTRPTRGSRRTTCCRSSSCTRSCARSSRAASASRWGAKAIPEGGYWAMPRLHAPGVVICGDAAGMVNVPAPQGRPLRDQVGDARRRDDLRAR